MWMASAITIGKVLLKQRRYKSKYCCVIVYSLAVVFLLHVFFLLSALPILSIYLKMKIKYFKEAQMDILLKLNLEIFVLQNS